MIEYFVMNPVVWDALCRQIPVADTSLDCRWNGIPVVIYKHVPIYQKKWQFPVTPFVEYEKSDEGWARVVGFGCEVDDVGNYCVYGIRERPKLTFDSMTVGGDAIPLSNQSAWRYRQDFMVLR